MTTRIIVAAFAIPILVLIILLAPVWALGFVVGVIAARCAWEFLYVAEKDAPIRISVYAALAALCIPFLDTFFDGGRVALIALFFLFAVLFCELMLSFRKETTMEFETVAVALLAGAVFPALLGGIVRLALRDSGNVYALLPFVVCFSSDSGAYFAGVFLGRHKLTPRLSPNKTLEGSIGGFLLAIALTLVYGLVLKAAEFEVNFAVMGVYGFLGSLAAQLGDLSFSAVKRLLGIKDYGNLIPGHGGMLDRFDSMIWCAALLELLAAWVPAITK